MPSTTTSEWKKMTDFGTYHHSTHRGSEKIRGKDQDLLFMEIFGDMPFARDDKSENTRRRLRAWIPLMRLR